MYSDRQFFLQVVNEYSKNTEPVVSKENLINFLSSRYVKFIIETEFDKDVAEKEEQKRKELERKETEQRYKMIDIERIKDLPKGKREEELFNHKKIHSLAERYDIDTSDLSRDNIIQNILRCEKELIESKIDSKKLSFTLK